MEPSIVKIIRGEGPVIATAIHDGHFVRKDIAPLFKLDDAGRLREEDPATAKFADFVPTQIHGLRSRFEVDLNRPPEKAVYQSPEDAWGLEVWQDTLPSQLVDQSQQLYRDFYTQVKALLDEKLLEHKYVFVYDIHSYNHRREGPNSYADPDQNPEINIGTGNLDRSKWGTVIDDLIGVMRRYNYMGRHLDVRENIKFRGGYFSKWIYENYGQRVGTVAIEFKKFFMNEWTGEIDDSAVLRIQELLRSTLPTVQKHLDRMNEKQSA